MEKAVTTKSKRFVASCNDRANDQFIVRVLRLRDDTDPFGDAGYCLDAPAFVPTGSCVKHADRFGEFLAVGTTERGRNGVSA